MTLQVRHSFSGAAKLATILLATGAMAACSSPMSSSRRFAEAPPAALPPVQNSSVSTTSLPPIDGSQQAQQGGYYTEDGTYVPAGAQPPGGQSNVMTTPDGRIITTGMQDDLQRQQDLQNQQQTGFPSDGSFVSQDPMLNGGGGFGTSTQTMDQQVALDPNGQPTQVATRDLSGGLTAEKLLGSWTVISGADTCRVNLTQTAATGTERFRASAPNCTIDVLNGIASWQLAGTQVQFFSEGGQLIGALLQSGNRFIGTLSGGRGISMAG